jgi:hypothetical protein
MDGSANAAPRGCPELSAFVTPGKKPPARRQEMTAFDSPQKKSVGQPRPALSQNVEKCRSIKRILAPGADRAGPPCRPHAQSELGLPYRPGPAATHQRWHAAGHPDRHSVGRADRHAVGRADRHAVGHQLTGGSPTLPACMKANHPQSTTPPSFFSPTRPPQVVPRPPTPTLLPACISLSFHLHFTFQGGCATE